VKLKSVLIILLSTFCAVSVQSKTSHQEISFKAESRVFTQVGVQTGGDGTEPLPIHNRGDGNYYYYSEPLVVFGVWDNVPSDASQFWEDEAKAGGFWKFDLGLETPLSENVVLSTAFGYQFDSIEGDLTDGSGGKGYFGMSRKTFDTIAFYNLGQHRLGLGAAFHFSPKFIHKEYGSNFDLKSRYHFEDAFGIILQYDYLVNNNVSLGVRLTKISYDISKLTANYQSGDSFDNAEVNCTTNCKDLIEADSLGVHLTYRF